MNAICGHTKLSGKIAVPSSKSHTIRALLFATIAEGTSYIHNPLPSADCLSTLKAIKLLGASVALHKSAEGNDKEKEVWEVCGAGERLHSPSDIVDVGNSGSLLYFMSPLVSVLPGISVFTGDLSIKTRPIMHVVKAIRQLGGEASLLDSKKDRVPLVITKPIVAGRSFTAPGALSQYISGFMIAGTLLNGKTTINLTAPKEIPFLNMTRLWQESLGVSPNISKDYKNIEVRGVVKYPAFNKTMPSDWEAVAFPLVAALITRSAIAISNIDTSASQGDAKIVEVLQEMGAKIQVKEDKKSGESSLEVLPSSLSLSHLKDKTLRINIAGFPDAICALAVAACYTDGKVILEDAFVCRKKETDRIKVMASLLSSLGASVEEGEDYLVIEGSPLYKDDGKINEKFTLHGGKVDSFFDHRVAMAMSIFGMALPAGESVTVLNAECCNVSFPNFYDKMNRIGGGVRVEE